MLVLLLSAGPMLTSLIVGLVISILQATTQIQEQTLSYVPKLIAVFLAISVLAPWMLRQLIQFTQTVFNLIVLVR
jgi:flagellar biosynthetic protein FliQ